MSVIRAWIPELYDPVLIPLITLHKLSDAEAADRMHFPPAEITKARKRLGLKANIPLKPRLRETSHSVTGKPDPLVVAQKWVPGFNRLNMTLNGKPVKLLTIMKKMNQALKDAAVEQIGPDSWRV